MYRSMSSEEMDNAIRTAFYSPSDLQNLTPRMFVERFGVPTDGQWAVLSGVLRLRCRVCVTASTPVAA